jgi:hypothetical protein
MTRRTIAATRRKENAPAGHHNTAGAFRGLAARERRHHTAEPMKRGLFIFRQAQDEGLMLSLSKHG